MNTPFVFGKTVSGDAFTDRENDTAKLVSNHLPPQMGKDFPREKSQILGRKRKTKNRLRRCHAMPKRGGILRTFRLSRTDTNRQ